MSVKKDAKGRNLLQGEDQMKDGRYRYRYTDSVGNRQQIYAWKLVPTDKMPKGKRESISLREKEKQIQKDLDDNIRSKDAEITVSQLIEKYLNTKAKLSKTTINNYFRLKEKNIDTNTIGRKKVKDVRRSDILAYYKYLYTEKGFSIGTVQLYQNLIYPAFQLAVDDGAIRVNPCRGCMKEYHSGSLSSEKMPLTDKEQDRLLSFVRENSFYNNSYCLIAFLLGSGCRIGEALGLTWEDINFEEGYADINHQLIYKEKIRGDGIRYFISPPKNRTFRKIPLQENVLTLLQKLKEETYLFSKISEFTVDGLTNFVFLNRNGKVTTPASFNRTLRGITNAINKKEFEDAKEEDREAVPFPNISAHTLRHTYCTRMAENGCDIKVLQEIMGHKNIAITMQVYNHATFDRNKKEVVNLLPVLKETY